MTQETLITFIQTHEAQLLSSGVPRRFWETLYDKLKGQIFDASNVFYLLNIDYNKRIKYPEDPLWALQVQHIDGIKYLDNTQIYLVDHAWTFRTPHAREQLSQIDSLLDRMCRLMGVDTEQDEEDRIDCVWNLLWKYCQMYTISNAELVEDRLPVWYIMDEVGSSIRHSDNPNFASVPFIYMPEQITYNLLFPIKDLLFEEMVTRDFVLGISNPAIRSALLLPWYPTRFIRVDHTQIEPTEEYFLSGHVRESLPVVQNSVSAVIARGKPLQVFAEYELVQTFLNQIEDFQITDNENNADILWYTRHFKKYADLPSHKFVNQFPFENVLTIKDLLAIVCRRKSSSEGQNPAWLPITYNLKTELNKFISYYRYRKSKHLDNHWICKPWNLARGLDTHVTSNIDYIVRLANTSPPKIVQKYLEDPVLFYRPECNGNVKFDLRYVILLKSVEPLEAYIYRNFFIRFSNKPFELNDFHDYEKHFTVMNYNKTVELKHMRCEEFLINWEEQYPEFGWFNVEQSIVRMFREMLEAASEKKPPCGIGHSPQSRALYAADIILAWEDGQIQPKLLEVNWTPDCKRACDYYPDFYNQIFSLLFLNKHDTSVFKYL